MSLTRSSSPPPSRIGGSIDATMPPYNGCVCFAHPCPDWPMNESRTLALENQDEAVRLFGQRDAYLRMIRDALAVRLIARGDTLTIDGPTEAVDQADRVFQQM